MNRELPSFQLVFDDRVLVRNDFRHEPSSCVCRGNANQGMGDASHPKLSYVQEFLGRQNELKGNDYKQEVPIKCTNFSKKLSVSQAKNMYHARCKQGISYPSNASYRLENIWINQQTKSKREKATIFPSNHMSHSTKIYQQFHNNMFITNIETLERKKTEPNVFISNIDILHTNSNEKLSHSSSKVTFDRWSSINNSRNGISANSRTDALPKLPSRKDHIVPVSDSINFSWSNSKIDVSGKATFDRWSSSGIRINGISSERQHRTSRSGIFSEEKFDPTLDRWSSHIHDKNGISLSQRNVSSSVDRWSSHCNGLCRIDSLMKVPVRRNRVIPLSEMKNFCWPNTPPIKDEIISKRLFRVRENKLTLSSKNQPNDGDDVLPDKRVDLLLGIFPDRKVDSTPDRTSSRH